MLFAKDWLECRDQCFRQTGGSRRVVSSYTELDGYLHDDLLKTSGKLPCQRPGHGLKLTAGQTATLANRCPLR
jgi:hypothetical protein